MTARHSARDREYDSHVDTEALSCYTQLYTQALALSGLCALITDSFWVNIFTPCEVTMFLSPTVLRTEGDLQVDHLYVCMYVCMFLTTLLLVDTTDTGFSLVECYGGFVWELIAYFVPVTHTCYGRFV